MEQDKMNKQAEELLEAAKPLIEYIRKNYTPMTTAIITGVSAEILSTDIGVKYDDDWA